MTIEEYKLLVLRSADESGRLHPPTLDSWWTQQQILVAMEIQDRTIKMTSRKDEPMRYAITNIGRAKAREAKP